jgi:hypothetical protein
MGYVIVAIVLMLIVAAFVTFLVLNSMRKGAGSGSADPSARRSDHNGTPGIGQDPTPLGDTSEHADDPGVGQDPAQPARPEERQRGDAGAGSGVQPESERLANRPL